MTDWGEIAGMQCWSRRCGAKDLRSLTDRKSTLIVHPCATWELFAGPYHALNSPLQDFEFRLRTLYDTLCLEAKQVANMVPDAPPPHRLVSSKPISMADASKMLDTYILNSEAHPHLHPDALITPTGVTFSSHGGPTGGVVMHNLRRIAAGLRGEYLEPEATPEPEEEEATEGGAQTFNGKKGKGKKTKFTDAEAGEVEIEWQDKEAYEREQGEIEIGELGDRTNVVQEGDEEVEATGEKRKGDSKLDKDARKKAKKERDAQRKKENEKKRAEKA